MLGNQLSADLSLKQCDHLVPTRKLYYQFATYTAQCGGFDLCYCSLAVEEIQVAHTIN